MIRIYYSNIQNNELAYFHNRPVHNFSIKLSDLLTSPLFQIEEIITDSIYRVYPLFYTNEITSSNPNDRILDNKCIICQKLESTEEYSQETFFTFISDENSEIVDYSEYGNYYEIGDQLTESEFNAYISLLRQNVRHTGSFRISQGQLNGSYGTYEFDIDGATLIDNGIIVTDETIASQPKVKLTDNVFRWSSYILKLDIIHYTGVNILDDTTSDFKVVETLEIELTPNEWVDIPVESLEQDYIISLDASVEIRHDKPEIHLISGVDITEITPNPIQIGQNTDIYAQLLDTDGQSYDLTDGVGKTVYFYEVLNPILYNLIAEPSIIQTSETTDITVQMKDSDGSKIGAGETVYFYAVEGAEPVPPTPTPVPTTLTLTSDKDILSYYDSDSAVLSATVKDQNGEVMSGQSVVFKKGSEVLATKTTDSVGVASYTYASQGVGDVTIIAECMNLVETYVIHDYWYINTNVYTTPSATLNVPLPPNFQLEYELTPTTRDGSAPYLDIGASSNNRMLVGQYARAGTNGIITYTGTQTNYPHTDLTLLNQVNNIKFTYTGGGYTYSLNDSPMTVANANISFDKIIHIESGGSGRLTNIKIIKL